MKSINKIQSIGSDLFTEFYCECPSERYKDNPILADVFKTKIKLTGYNDDYFFDVVNKESREISCKCGKKYNYQWTLDGVIVESV